MISAADKASITKTVETLAPFVKEVVKELGLKTPAQFEANIINIMNLAIEKERTYWMDIVHGRTENGRKMYAYISESCWRKLTPGKYDCKRCGCETANVFCAKCEVLAFPKKNPATA